MLIKKREVNWKYSENALNVCWQRTRYKLIKSIRKAWLSIKSCNLSRLMFTYSVRRKRPIITYHINSLNIYITAINHILNAINQQNNPAINSLLISFESNFVILILLDWFCSFKYAKLIHAILKQSIRHYLGHLQYGLSYPSI